MTRSFVLRIFESYFRHRWLNLLPIVLMLGAAGGYLLVKPRLYMTAGLIYVPGQSYLAALTNLPIDQTSPYVSPAQGTTSEIKELMQTDTFIRSVIAKSDLAPALNGTPDNVNALLVEVRKDVWATAQGNNQVLVAAQDKNPVIAFQLATAIIENYTQWRIDGNLAQSSVAQTFFGNLVQKYSAEVDTARQALNNYLLQHPQPLTGTRPDVEQIEIDRLKSDLDQAQARYTSALDKQENTVLAASQATVNTRQSLYVVDAPTIPDRPATSLRQTATQGGVFVAVGVILTLVAVVGGAILDRRFLFPIDVRQSLDLPVLAVIPDATPRRPSKGRADDMYSEVIVRPGPALPSAVVFRPGQSAGSHSLAAPQQNREPRLPVEQGK